MIRNYLICDKCGKEFGFCESIIKFRLERNKHFFCSKECYLSFHSNQKKVKCITCGKIFNVRGYRIKNTKNFYCSRKCKKISKQVKCNWCKKLFYRKPSLIRGKNNFCSQKCMGRWQSKYKRGENSNSWLGGWEKYYGANWKEQKNLTRKRDKYICQLCAKSESKKTFDVHHKIPFRKFGIKRYLEANDLSNLITLCNSCHSKIEPRKIAKLLLTAGNSLLDN